nr:PREDICTED: uncharacterized protein LOC109030031 [Bemisia tabaci]
MQDLTVVGPALVMSILKRFSEEIMGRFEDQREGCKKCATLTEIEDFLKSETCSSALLVTGLICLIVGFVAQFLSLTVHIAAWIAKGQQLQHGAANAHPTFFIKRTTEMPFIFSEEPTMRTTLTVTALFILTAMYLIYTFYFIMTVTSYTAHIGEVRVR